MTYTQLSTLDSSNGSISVSDRGYVSNTLLLLDNPVVKIDFNGSSAAYAIMTIEDANNNTVAEWNVDNTIEVNYIEIGDVLRYAVQPSALTANQFTDNAVTLYVTVVSYDSGDNALKTTSLTWAALRSSKYTALASGTLWYYSLPSRFRMLFSGTPYDYTHYNIVAAYPRSAGLSYRVYNGTSLVSSKSGSLFTRHQSSNYLAGTRITHVDIVTLGNVTERAGVEMPACATNLIALKWWSRIGGCWKSILLDVVGGGYTSDNTVDYWTDMEQDQLKIGTTYITARFPNATYKDYLYYSDIVLGEHMTASFSAANGYEGVFVKVAGNWSYKQNDIKDMDFTITIKQYDIDD